MRDTEPSVSTAGRRRMIALRLAMRWTPIASVIVMSAGRPSGISDTAMPTIAWNNSTKSMPMHPAAVGEHQHADDRDARGDQVAEPLDLAQEWRLRASSRSRAAG